MTHEEQIEILNNVKKAGANVINSIKSNGNVKMTFNKLDAALDKVLKFHEAPLFLNLASDDGQGAGDYSKNISAKVIIDSISSAISTGHKDIALSSKAFQYAGDLGLLTNIAHETGMSKEELGQKYEEVGFTTQTKEPHQIGLVGRVRNLLSTK